MALSEKDKENAKYVLVRYTGGKADKSVSWIASRPVFSEVNNYTAEISVQDAARLLRQSPDIFKLVTSVDEPLKRAKPAPEKPKVEEAKAAPKKPASRRLYGRTDGSPFSNLAAAKSAVFRFSASMRIPKEDLEVIDTVDGFFVAKKEKEDPAFSEGGEG